MAAQGQSGFLSAGDSGAYDASRDLGTTNLSVDTSADSPYITAAGGTTLPWTGTLTGPDGTATVTVPKQRAWGWDYLWPAIAKINGESEARRGGGQHRRYRRRFQLGLAGSALPAVRDPARTTTTRCST